MQIDEVVQVAIAHTVSPQTTGNISVNVTVPCRLILARATIANTAMVKINRMLNASRPEPKSDRWPIKERNILGQTCDAYVAQEN